MRRIGKLLIVSGLALLVAGTALLGVGIWFVRRPWPQVSGPVAVSGLSAPVEVIRDPWGVPHIYAQNEYDLFFAQGYVHAQDRLWQMEFNRRVGNGTLSAVLGRATLDADRFLRTIGLRRAAEQEWASLDDDNRAILTAYAAGVNAYIEAHRDRLPLEFTLLGVDPAPWRPVDSLVWGKVISLDLGRNYNLELLRALIIAELGEQAAQQLLPPYAGGVPIIIPPEAGGYDWLRQARSQAPLSVVGMLKDVNPSWGSNNWAVHGSRTTTGMPMLANDTHLGLGLPSAWYENGLHGGRFDSAGFSFPGVPLVIIGHNDCIAWGVTNLGPDVQDLYLEKLDDPTQPSQYEFKGEWQNVQVVQEVIEVKGQAPVALNVYLTRHGPLMNDVIEGLPEAKALALSWTALKGAGIFSAIKQVNLATNWDEFRRALRDWEVPGQNFVYADREGNIGYQATGRIPLRAPGHQGLVPVPGWTGEYEWQGFIPFEEMPSAFNPPSGFIVTANNKVIPDDYPHVLAYEWDAPYRARRITDLLAADNHLTLEAMRNIQAQTYMLVAETMRPNLLTVEPENDLQARALAQVEAWDLYAEADRVGAAVYQVWYWFLVQNTFGDELGNNLMDEYLSYASGHVPLMVDLMAQAESPWFDNVDTPQEESRDDIVRRSLADAVAWLSERYGDVPDQWAWGRLHTITFVHQPLGESGISLIEYLFNSQPIPARGDNFTVNAAAFRFNDPFAMSFGTSQRLIVDLSDLDNSLAIHTTGQSGQLFHPHREDFIGMWQNVEYHPMFFSREVVAANAKARLVLTSR